MSHRTAAATPLVLIALCAAAFLRAEQLKLHHSAVGHPHVRQAFSPGCTDPGCLPVARPRFTLGLAAYLALVGSIAWAAFRSGPDRLLRFGLAGALAAVLTSSLFYNAYFEDPASWILTALIVSVAALPNIRIRQARA